jgi:predicted transcriptional regulator
MRTLTITVQSSGDFFDEAHAAAGRIDAGNGYQGETYSFASLPLLFQVFTPRRWELIQRLQAIGPVSLRSLARALGRDVKRVHEDVALLLEEGIIERDTDKKLCVPFATITIEAHLTAPAAA